tara:strand:- start:59 stop:340 length:282 start_codon:yes stop_codon:yes gene_type:complete
MTEHDKKYRAICKKANLTISFPFMGRELEEWKTLFAEDKHLNNVMLIHWDKKAEGLKQLFFQSMGSWSLCLGVCSLKYLIKRKVQGKKDLKKT